VINSYLVVHDLVRLDGDALALGAKLSGSGMIPASHALWASLALKLWSKVKSGKAREYRYDAVRAETWSDVTRTEALVRAALAEDGWVARKPIHDRAARSRKQPTRISSASLRNMRRCPSEEQWKSPRYEEAFPAFPESITAPLRPQREMR